MINCHLVSNCTQQSVEGLPPLFFGIYFLEKTLRCSYYIVVNIILESCVDGVILKCSHDGLFHRFHDVFIIGLQLSVDCHNWLLLMA